MPLMGRAGLKIRAADGLTEPGFPEMMSSPMFYEAVPGDRLILKDRAYKFNVATYLPEIEPRWIYTYDYAPEQSWTVYRHDLSGESYRKDEYVFGERLYFRVCLRKLDGSRFTDADDINDILVFETLPRADKPVKPWIMEEARRVVSKVNFLRKPGDLAFAVLTDTHWTVNGTWSDTMASMKAVNELIRFDGVIHLGDLTDGMTPGEVTRHYVNKVITDMKEMGAPLWIALGNHDSNYFKKNPDRFSLEEQSAIYLDGRKSPRYYTDFEDRRLRLIFLDSFDMNEEVRYGYSLECVRWLAETIDDMAEGWRALICSHLPPTARLQYWAKEIRGDNEIMAVLTARADRVLAFINGHNHADRVDNEAFPIISVANAKLEAFTEYKAEGFITPERKAGTPSQECWDVLLVRAEGKGLDFIRFGAGTNRRIDR